MAAAQTDQAELEIGEVEINPDDDDASLLECLSCNEQEGYLVNPKILQCRHTFCVVCLANHCVDDVITCYKCGEKTVSSIEDLPSALTKPTFCGTCEKIDKIQCKTANMYCVACDVMFCAAHIKVHNSIINHHQMLTIRNYLKSSYAQEMRFCESHKDRVLSLGCSKCWMITCAKCLNENLICEQAKGACGSNHHSLVSIEHVAERLRAEVEPITTVAEDKFDEIAALVKEITIILSEWDTETEHAVRLIHQTKDQQISAVEEKYAKLESDYTESRKACKEKITSYMAGSAGPKMSDFLNDIKTLRSNLSDLHSVDLVRERREIEKRINELIEEDFPVLLLSSQTKPSKTDTERRELEIKLLPVDDVIFGDKIGRISKTPPSSLQLVRNVSTGNSPVSVCHYKGYTYAGRVDGKIDRIDDQGNVTSPFINQGYGQVISVKAHEDQLYVLVYGSPYTVYVHDMSGKQLKSWKHSDTNGAYHGSKLVFINSKLTITHSSSKQILTYDLANGRVVKTISCPQITGHYLAMCEGGGDSVVISDYGSSKVFKLNLTTELIEWTSTHVQNPEGVTLLGPHHVAVSYCGAGTKVWILSLETGEMVRELTDTSISGSSHIFDMWLYEDTLIIPRYSGSKVLYYRLIK